MYVQFKRWLYQFGERLLSLFVLSLLGKKTNECIILITPQVLHPCCASTYTINFLNNQVETRHTCDTPAGANISWSVKYNIHSQLLLFTEHCNILKSAICPARRSRVRTNCKVYVKVINMVNTNNIRKNITNILHLLDDFCTIRGDSQGRAETP